MLFLGMCACMHVYEHMCEGQWPSFITRPYSTLFFETRSHTKPVAYLTNSARLAGQRALGILLCPPPQPVITAVWYRMVSHMRLGTKFRFSCLHGKHITDRASPSELYLEGNPKLCSCCSMSSPAGSAVCITLLHLG